MAEDMFTGGLDLSGEGYNADADNLVLNLDSVNENAGFECMPQGTYEAIIEGTEYGLSANGGNPMITWTFRITEEPYVNRKQFFHTVLNKDLGVASLKKILTRCCPDVAISSFSPKAFCDNGDGIGMACKLKLKIEPYNGEKRNKVQEVLAPAAAGTFLDGNI